MPTTKAYEMSQNSDNRFTCLYFHVDIAPFIAENFTELNISENSFLYDFLNGTRKMISQFNNPQKISPYMSDILTAYLKETGIFKNVPQALNDAVTYISSHISESISVNTLAQISGYNRKYFIRIFKNYFGVTPHAFIIKYKMKIAISCIENDMPCYQIADYLGFSEPKNFSRCFKNIYGVSPSNYKNIVNYII